MIRFIASCCIIILAASAATATEWPKVEGSKNNPHCLAAVQIAKATFRPHGHKSDIPLAIPENLSSKIVLKSNGSSEEVSALIDPDFFDADPLHGASSSFYWQRIPLHGFRLAVTIIPMGMKGNMYSLYVVPDDVTADQFWDEYQQFVTNRTRMNFVPVIKDSWSVPIVMANGIRPAWFIDTGWGDKQAPWTIY